MQAFLYDAFRIHCESLVQSTMRPTIKDAHTGLAICSLSLYVAETVALQSCC